MTQADVTICIPTWQAASFIERTIRCAQAQTHSDVRILVSVDQCEDDTAAICRRLAKEDGRISVFEQSERLGWSQNSNFLIGKADSTFFCLYFHDDIIEPNYVADLRALLLARPDAASASSAIQRFGDIESIQNAESFDGSDFERMARYLAIDVRGLMLRALIRRRHVGDALAFPVISGDGSWRVPSFEMHLVAAGPALSTPAPLYKRWIREGSMTQNWRAKTIEEFVEGQARCADVCAAILDDLRATPREKEVLQFALATRLLFRARKAERALGWRDLIDRGSLGPLFGKLIVPRALADVEPTIQDALLQSYVELISLEAGLYVERNDIGAALAKLSAALALSPTAARLKTMAAVLKQSGAAEEAAALAFAAARERRAQSS